MGIQRRILKSLILFAGDMTALYAALFTMLIIRYHGPVLHYYLTIHFIPFSSIFIAWSIAFYISGLYELRMAKNAPAFYDRLYKTFLFNSAIAVSIFYLLPYARITPRINLFVVIAVSFVFIAAWRWTAQSIMATRGASRVLFFGLSKEITEFADFLKQNPQLGYLPVAAMTTDEEETPRRFLLRTFSFNHNLPYLIQEEGIEIIVASSAIKKNESLVRMLFQVVPLGIPVFNFLSFSEAVTGKIPISLVGETWFLENLIGVKKNYYEFFKRIIDFIIAVLLGIPALILFPMIAFAIAVDSSGSVFYRQRRVGRSGKEFWLVKYRTMVKDAEKIDGKKGTGVDPRLTKIGALLRKSYLDELPQIINILKNEMSFVGPRPERPEFVHELKTKIPFYEMRLLVAPGISGWAQVNMENDASVEDALEKLQYDLAYIKNRSVWLDLNIALRTIMTMLSRGGR